ncbi:hypothetical protein CMK12_14185 [Candidatus Poribacteria bacterium]|nr:hypothetical protein [Candidatus Poribacteria bacterium]
MTRTPIRQSFPTANRRAILFGLILLPFEVYWVTVAEMKYGSQATALPLFIYPVFILFCLVVINNGLSLSLRLRLFTAADLLTTYVMLVIGTSLSAYGMLQDLFAVVVHPYRFASAENDWRNLFFHYIPRYFTVSSPNILTGYYEGDSTLYRTDHLQEWLLPAVTWIGFMSVLLLLMHCLNTLLRRQWIQNERLAFPVIQLPLNMVQSSSFFRSRMLWIGFAVVAAFDILSGLNTLFPSVPHLHLKLFDIKQYFTEKPWNAIGTTRISFYPFMIGIGFFLPLDLSFSCWFFFILRKLSRILTTYLGLNQIPGFPFFHEQSAGAWVCLAGIACWLTRKHLAFALRIARSPLSQIDAKEPMRYRTALIGLIVCSLFLLVFGHLANMSIMATITFFSIYFAIAVAVTRLRAEFGAPHGIFNHPLEMMVTVFGSKWWGASNLTAMSFFFWFNRGYRPHPMPNQFEALKIAENAKIKNSRFLWAMIAAGGIGLIGAFWVNLDMMYRDGAISRGTGFRLWVGNGAMRQLSGWLQNPISPEWKKIGFMGVGAFFTLILLFLRIRFFWWPLHPAGYSLAVSFAIDYFWCPFFISWLSKTIILRTAGVKGYQRAVPFFFGLILGDFVVGSWWMLFGMVADVKIYHIFI